MRTLTKRIGSGFNKWVQARTGEGEGGSGTVKYAARVVKDRRKKRMTQHEDQEGQQRQIVGRLVQTDTATRPVPKWSGIIGGKRDAQELLS